MSKSHSRAVDARRGERAAAEERAGGKRKRTGTRSSPLTRAEREELATLEYIDHITSDKGRSLAFLKAAGIVDGKGKLTKPYRD